jgi:sugar phosphate isomerase/epimerase
VLVSGALQALLVGGDAFRANVLARLRRPRLDLDVRQFFRALGPATLGSAGVQLALFADTVIASFLPAGALSALYYADRLNQLPIGVIGIAAGTVILPEMARRIAAGDEGGARAAQNRAIEFSLLLSVPCVAAFFAVPEVIMRALFMRGAFTAADAQKAIADFNEFGRAMKAGGLQFFYHNHGYEPVQAADGTLLDVIIKGTDPDLVKFEEDVLWTYLPGVDPAALLRKYPGRFKLMHIKDMKPGVARGSLSGGLPDSLQAVIGRGQVNWPDVMKAAKASGVEYYYLEDETPDPVNNIPPSINYLERITF